MTTRATGPAYVAPPFHTVTAPDPLDAILRDARSRNRAVIARPVDDGDRWLYSPRADPREARG